MCAESGGDYSGRTKTRPDGGMTTLVPSPAYRSGAARIAVSLMSCTTMLSEESYGPDVLGRRLQILARFSPLRFRVMGLYSLPFSPSSFLHQGNFEADSLSDLDVSR
jgi:hypothetical protein